MDTWNRLPNEVRDAESVPQADWTRIGEGGDMGSIGYMGTYPSGASNKGITTYTHELKSRADII